jgi:cell division protein FtsB
MKHKYKITGFSRLLIFMIFFAPLAYIGASYYNGEDGIAKIKSLFEKNEGGTVQEQIDTKKIELEQLNRKVESLKKDIDQLEAGK